MRANFPQPKPSSFNRVNQTLKGYFCILGNNAYSLSCWELDKKIDSTFKSSR